ncbi:hypothetical protein PRIPAC_87111 [Pristionchus pacificus]|uniref:Uncharacterized protein n=1 Tax=Pristionchus pacificus TaxID=54126 RepID=A0A2A6CVU5_PRIPA|nr:hypothetical protein PRIPAC_87111 [Pristionchus pacificus]|eukprot:PDM82352.1 hypothetical protein PRIPAC_36745 [Pristionchus pacificus]
MLLRVEDLSALSGLTMQNAFVIGDQIIGVSIDLDDPWAMYSIDTETFAVKELPVVFENKIAKKTWDRIHYPVVVHDNVAYAWFDCQCRFAAGTIENGSFHWRFVDTHDTPIMAPLPSIDCREGSSSTFTIMFCKHSAATNPRYFMAHLSLSTLTWGTPIEIHEKLVQEALFMNPSIWVTSTHVHVIAGEFGKIRKHLIMDMTNNEWAEVKYDEGQKDLDIFAQDRGFKTLGNLYCFGVDKEFGCRQNALFRFDATQKKWIKVHQFGPSEIIHSRPEIVVVGSRVIVLDCEGGLDSMKKCLTRLKVIDLSPTLQDRALAVVARNKTLYQLDRNLIPRNIANSLFRDESGDEKVPKRMKNVSSYFDDAESWSYF